MTAPMPKRTLAVLLVGIAVLCAAMIALAMLLVPARVAPPKYQVLSFADLDQWDMQDHRPSFQAFRLSCEPYVSGRLPRSRLDTVTPGWYESCVAAQQVPATDAAAVRQFFEQHFQPLRLYDGQADTGLLTGYYVPHLHGSFTPSDRYHVPLYALPDDLLKIDLGAFRPDLQGQTLIGQRRGNAVVPYADRAAIEQGALAERGRVLLWLDNPIDAFFLHIQGSGLVELPDGSHVKVGYAGRNGHAYYAIGRDLRDSGAISPEQMSMQTIRQWLVENPDEGRSLMQKNPSYIFFRLLEDATVVGTQGVALTPGYSLAVDRQYHPLGLPFWIETQLPTSDGAAMHRLMISQDTGGAIKGPLRGDVFFGEGPEAAEIAGKMKQDGRFVLLWPRQVP